jgi:hypothetical protein
LKRKCQNWRFQRDLAKDQNTIRKTGEVEVGMAGDLDSQAGVVGVSLLEVGNLKEAMAEIAAKNHSTKTNPTNDSRHG